MPPPLRITIESTTDGYLRWEMFYGPGHTLHFAGTAPLLERVFQELIRTQWVLADQLTDDPDPLLHVLADDTPDPPPAAQVQTPPGHTLPAQQDIPARAHTPDLSPFIYPLPTESG